MKTLARCVAACALVSIPCAASPVAAQADKARLASQVKDLLKTHCYGCHGKDGAAEGGFSYIMDAQSLINRRKVVPGQPTKSPLYKRAVTGEMPPEDVKKRPSDAELKVLKQWIEADAPDFDAASSKRAFLKTADVIQAIRTDLDKRNPRDRRFARYFTLAHLYNAGLADDELQTYRNALSKLINNLSWGRKVVPPRAVDKARVVLAIDLRDYKWNEKTWDLLLGRYPYGVVHDAEAAKECATLTGCRLPFVRGDWFVATAARPPLYHELLQVPATEKELEKLLRVDAAENIRDERVARAGFNASGVSKNNRLIERHESTYGAYWKSYDFAGAVGRQNLFTHPIGPGDGDSAFKHDGGELIFHLPNGLLGFMLVDGKGARLDKAPIDVVSDPKRPDRKVENGLSCMSCHARGLIPKDDQVRAHVEKNRKSFGKAEAEAVMALYPARDKFAELIKEDTDRYQKAVTQAGAPLTTTEPVVALALQFEAELSLPLAAAECGLEPEAFLKGLKAAPLLARALGSLQVKGGTVQRQVFADVFPDLVIELKIGAFFDPATSGVRGGPVVKIELTTGKIVSGTLLQRSLLVKSDEGELAITASKIRSLSLDKDVATIVTPLGKVEGKLLTEEFKVETELGALTIARDKVKAITFEAPKAGTEVSPPSAGDGTAGAIKPPTLEKDVVVRQLPAAIGDVAVGGGGRYLILHLPKQRKLALFDANEGKVSAYIPVGEDKVRFAAGRDKLVVVLPDGGLIQRWDLHTQKRELSIPLPTGVKGQGVVMGSASQGPVLVDAELLDLTTFKPLKIRKDRSADLRATTGNFVRVSADGRVFGQWRPNLSPQGLHTVILTATEAKGYYDHNSVGHLVPGPDGKYVYTARGIFTNQVKEVHKPRDRDYYALPAHHGPFYVRLTVGDDAKMTLHMGGESRTLLTLRDVEVPKGINHWAREEFGYDRRIHLIPAANLLVTIPDTNDRLVLHRFDLDKALDKSGIDYLYVTTQPPDQVSRGGTLSYQMAVHSKKGGVKYRLDSGPKGMEITSGGLLKWNVPADFDDKQVDVIVSVSDKSEQEIFQTFKLSIEAR